MPKVLPGGCQEEAQKRKAKKKNERQTRMAEKEESGDKSRKKWLKVSRKQPAYMIVSRRPLKERWSKVLCEAWIAHKSKMKKRRKAGEKETRWLLNGRKSKNWRRSWQEEGCK